MKRKIQSEIVNIVASTNSDVRLNLNLINETLENTEYNPEVYFALIYKPKHPRVTILVNWSGKLIFTGAKTIDDVKKVRNIFFKEIEIMGYHPKKNDLVIQNIVLNAIFCGYIDLSAIQELGLAIPKKRSNSFPGICYKNQEPRFTALLFKTGKVVITGLKDFEQIENSLNIIKQLISKPGFSNIETF